MGRSGYDMSIDQNGVVDRFEASKREALAEQEEKEANLWKDLKALKARKSASKAEETRLLRELRAVKGDKKTTAAPVPKSQPAAKRNANGPDATKPGRSAVYGRAWGEIPVRKYPALAIKGSAENQANHG